MAKNNIRFFIDVDNETRLPVHIVDEKMYETLKEGIKEFKYGGKLHFEIKKLGILELTKVIPSAKDRALILKTTMIVDMTEDLEAEEVDRLAEIYG